MLRLGGVVNPINMMLTPDEVVYVTKDCGAKALLASVDRGSPIIHRQSETPLEHIVLFGEDVPYGATSFDRLLADSGDDFAEIDIEPSALGRTFLNLPQC